MKPKRILIAEDNCIISLSLSRELEQAGYLTAGSLNGRCALNKLTDTNCDPFDLLITDIRMPEMNGIALIKRIRALSMNLPIIVMTAETVPKTAAELQDLGVSAVLEKPFEIHKLKELVSALL